MARKKNTDIKIKIAIISGIFLVIAYVASAYLGSPLVDTQWQERPVVGVSLSDSNDYPKKNLESAGNLYSVKVFAKNRGQSDGKFSITAIGTDAHVSFFENELFFPQQSLQYTIPPLQNYSALKPPIYIIPNQDSKQFSIEILVDPSPDKHHFQELSVFIPTKLTFEKVDGILTLVSKR